MFSSDLWWFFPCFLALLIIRYLWNMHREEEEGGGERKRRDWGWWESWIREGWKTVTFLLGTITSLQGTVIFLLGTVTSLLGTVTFLLGTGTCLFGNCYMRLSETVGLYLGTVTFFARNFHMLAMNWGYEQIFKNFVAYSP